MPKNAEIYECKSCNFLCTKKSNYTKHILTAKHKIRTNTNEKMPKDADKYQEYICECSKTFKHASSLWNHKQKCKFQKIDEINDTVISEKKEEVIIQLSHWGYSYWILIINMREALNIPLNSLEEIRQEEYRMTWCEKHHGPGDYEQTKAINHQCPDGFTRLQLTEAFEDFNEDLAVNYMNRIRGGIERFGIFPNLDIEIAASGEISLLEGGEVKVSSGDLSGAELIINADPNPEKPNSYNWNNRWRPESHPSPNSGITAVRPINEYMELSDYLDSAKDNFTAVIGTQNKLSPTEMMPIHPNAVSESIFFGPHRTTLNAPAVVTISYDKEKVKRPEMIRPYVFNVITEEYELLPRVRKEVGSFINRDNNTVSFESQILGQFILVEEL